MAGSWLQITDSAHASLADKQAMPGSPRSALQHEILNGTAACMLSLASHSEVQHNTRRIFFFCILIKRVWCILYSTCLLIYAPVSVCLVCLYDVRQDFSSCLCGVTTGASDVCIATVKCRNLNHKGKHAQRFSAAVNGFYPENFDWEKVVCIGGRVPCV